MAAKIGVKIELEGAPQYIENMNKLTAQTKLYQAQMKRVQQELSNSSAFQKSIATSEALGQQLESLQNKSKYLQKEIAKEAAKSDELSSREIYLRTQYENLQTEILKTSQALKEQGGVVGAVGAQMQETGEKLKNIGDKMSEIGSSLTTKISAPLAAVGAASVKTFADWESAFTGVMKTVDESANTTYADIEEGIKKLATSTASSKEEIAGVAEAAGQLGVGADDILKFTETMVMLGDSTNLSAEEAATALARISNITGDSLNDVDRLGASIVALGNSFATNESSIVEMSNRLASAGSIAGMSTTEIFALATAMSSVGIEAEAGGTAMTQTLTGISKAVSESGEKLQLLAQISGTTAEDFASKWKSEPTAALQDFINGLSEMNASGQDTYKVLDELGMSGIRQSNMLQSLSLASDQLASAIEVSNKAYQENSALTDEASKRYETFNAQLNQAKESLSNAGIEIGQVLMPYVQELVTHIQELATWFANLSPGMQETIVKIGALVAAVGPMLSIVGKVVSSIGTLSSGIGSVIKFLPTITGLISTIASVLAGTVVPAIVGMISAIIPFLPVIAGLAAAITGVILIIQNWGTITEWFSEIWTSFTTFIDEKAAQISAIFTEGFNYLSNLFTTSLEKIKATIKNAANNIIVIITSWGANLKSNFTQTWNNIASIVKNAWSNIVSTITTFKAKVIVTIVNLLSSIKSKFTELKNNALSWGRDFVQNFVNGITDKMNALVDKVRSMADTIRSYLHFSTPDIGPLKDANKWPRDFVEQYAEGIESARYLIQNAVGDVATDVAVLQNPINADEIYSAIRSGASDATLRLAIGDREFGRTLRDMGVVFNG